MNKIPMHFQGVKCMQLGCRNQSMHKVGEYNNFNKDEESEQYTITKLDIGINNIESGDISIEFAEWIKENYAMDDFGNWCKYSYLGKGDKTFTLQIKEVTVIPFENDIDENPVYNIHKNSQC